MGVTVKKWLCLLVVLSAFVYGCDSAAERTIEPVKPMLTESGTVAQVHVKGAMVIADKTGSNGIGNFDLDNDEVYTFSGEKGEFTLDIPKEYGEYVLLSIGGKITDSNGKSKIAFPMLALKGAKNITPVTTLVALYPSLKEKIGTDYDVDIASGSVNWNIMKLAKTVEGVLSVFTNENNPMVIDIQRKFGVVQKIAAEFGAKGADLTTDAGIVLCVEKALSSILKDNTLVDTETRLNAVGITTVVRDGIKAALGVIPNSGTISEDTILAASEQAVSNINNKIDGNMLAFDPTQLIIPFPNDMAWASPSIPAARKGLVTLDLSAAQDTATKALYTAINNLKVMGLSPNAPIGIPLASAIKIDPTSLQNNIKVVNLTTMFGVLYSALKLGDPKTALPELIQSGVITALAKLDSNGWKTIQSTLSAQPYAGMIFKSIKNIQDGNYIKLFSKGPLESNSKFLVYIQDKKDDSSDDFVDENGIKVKSPTLYKFLQSESELTDSLAALEEVRKNYAPLYNYILKALGLNKDDTIEMFTFTTADKTLSLPDAAVIQAAIKTNDFNSLNNVTGLSYGKITGEYGNFDNALKYNIIQGPPVVTPTTFTSFDITTLQSTPPKPLTVTYKIYNGNNYNNTVVIFQHGLNRQKEDAAALANSINFPIIAMDLPLHGERKDPAKNYFSQDMLTTRINLYQSIFDMSLMLKAITNGQIDINGDQMPDRPQHIYFVGQSLGAITGSMFSSYNSNLDKVVLNVGGANLAGLLDGATNAEIAKVFTLAKNNTQYFITLGVLQMLIDPADPAYLANTVNKDKTIIQTAYKDTVVPNVCNEILSVVCGYSASKNIYDFAGFAASDNIKPGWYQFGGTSSLTANWVNHGFLLNPNISGYTEAAGYLNQDYVNGAYNAVRSQVNTFLSN